MVKTVWYLRRISLRERGYRDWVFGDDFAVMWYNFLWLSEYSRPVAQLVRALSLYLSGRWFESSPAYIYFVIEFKI